MDAFNATVLFIDKNIPIHNSTKVVASDEIKSNGKNIKIAQLKLDATLKNRRIEFLSGKDVLTEDSKVIVDHICEILEKYPDIKVEIGGHTDSVGSKESNQILSEKRALAVKRYLIEHDIDENRLVAVGYGETKPLVDDKIGSTKQLNRRVELKAIKQKETE